jgi:predicted regulator of Ras-like GTPase activity (Roadblock/LC7/MglB family)
MGSPSWDNAGKILHIVIQNLRFLYMFSLFLTQFRPCAKVFKVLIFPESVGKSVVKEYKLTKSRNQLMVERLRELQASSPDIEASAIVSVDGLTIASALPQGIEEDRVSAMSAAMLSLGERIASELGRGTLEQVYIKGISGYVVLMSVGEDAVLTALAREQAKLGLIFLDMRRATEDLRKLI